MAARSRMPSSSRAPEWMLTTVPSASTTKVAGSPDTRSSALEAVAVDVLALVLTKVRVDLRAGFRPGVSGGLEVRVTRR